MVVSTVAMLIADLQAIEGTFALAPNRAFVASIEAQKDPKAKQLMQDVIKVIAEKILIQNDELVHEKGGLKTVYRISGQEPFLLGTSRDPLGEELLICIYVRNNDVILLGDRQLLRVKSDNAK